MLAEPMIMYSSSTARQQTEIKPVINWKLSNHHFDLL